MPETPTAVAISGLCGRQDSAEAAFLMFRPDPYITGVTTSATELPSALAHRALGHKLGSDEVAA